jgi:4-amino-4-deoxy-L-arabinose transferase-like glycosyltransferase
MSCLHTNEAAIRAGLSGQGAAPVNVPSYADRSSSVTRTDVLVFALILCFGASAFIFHRRSSDFLSEDVYYADSARSLLEHGFYGINGHAETNQPPGLPAILAILFIAFGYGPTICLHAMAVFETLGFLATYELLRRHLPKLFAAAICIVLISSPIYFQMATQETWPCLPVFCTTTIALLAFEECQKAVTSTRRLIWGLVLMSAIVASVMIASATIALLGAIVAVIGLTSFTDKGLALAQLKRFLPVLLVGIIVQGLWMHRKPVPLEWR